MKTELRGCNTATRRFVGGQTGLMRKALSYVVLCMITVLALAAAATAAAGPQTAWITISLPNAQVTPDWKNYAPPDCPDPLACASDHRFWEEWDFSVFSDAIDASFKAIALQGRYQGVMVLMPLADSPKFWNNIKLTYRAAAKYGLAFEVGLFPKWKYGAEWCYLYTNDAPPNAPCIPGPSTSTSLAYLQLRKMLAFVEQLSGPCNNNLHHTPFAIWYGWNDFNPAAGPGYEVLKNFWLSLPTASGCNQQASYLAWLDEPFADTPEIQQLQTWVEQRHQPFWVNTELYDPQKLDKYKSTYAPYQTIITGVWDAANVDGWANYMCVYWTTAGKPARFGTWTFYDNDTSSELYRAYINGAMAVVGQICPD